MSLYKHHVRRGLFSSVVLYFLYSVAFLSSTYASQSPNIIFILTDDLGYGDIGVLHQKQRTSGVKISTPELDKMIAEGTLLDRHYVPAPVCAPSRGSLLSGQHQGHANVRDNQFDKAIENNHNIATTLKQANYYTAIVGKYGLQGKESGQNSPTTWPAYPTKRGFNYFYGYATHVAGHQHYPANSWPLGNSVGHRSPQKLYENNQEISATLDKCYTTDLFTARAKKLIIDRTQNHASQPFFLYLAYDTPHGAVQLPTVAYPAGKGIHGGIQWNGTSGNMINTATGTIDSYKNPLYTGKGLSDIKERHATMVTRIDHAVGDLLQTLKDLNIDSNTIVVFSSDNGPHSESYISGVSHSPQSFESYGPLEGMKRDVYEGGIRVPTIAWGPSNVAINHISSTPSQFHDWSATFCDYAGISHPARMDGISLKPTIMNSGRQKPGIVYVEYSTGGSMPGYFSNNGGTSRNQSQMIYVDGYKGVRNNLSNHSPNFKIFETLNDKDESNNLSGTNSTFTTLNQKMKDRILQIRMPNSSASRPYDNESVPAASLTDPVPSLIVKSYEGSWEWIPEFRALSAKNTHIDTGISLKHLSKNEQAGLLFSGYIYVPQAGTWTFYSQSDAGVILRLHEKLVLDADFEYNGSEVSQSVSLKAGYHPFRLYYRTKTQTPKLSLKWSGPATGNVKMDIPNNHFFHSDSIIQATQEALPVQNSVQRSSLSKPHNRLVNGQKLQREQNTKQVIF